MYPSKAIQAASAVLFQRRQEAQQQALDRRSEIYARHPEFRSFDRQIQGLAGGIAAAALSPDGPARVEELMNRIKGLQAEKRALCRRLGLPEDVFEPRYTCPICQDTGFVDGKRCQPSSGPRAAGASPPRPWRGTAPSSPSTFPTTPPSRTKAANPPGR